MDAKNQEILRRTGQRDAYLTRQSTIADAKRILRQEAISKGIAKPARLSSTRADVARHLFNIANQRPFKTDASNVNLNTISKNVSKMTTSQVNRAANIGGHGELFAAIESQDFISVDGENLLYYK